MLSEIGSWRPGHDSFSWKRQLRLARGSASGRSVGSADGPGIAFPTLWCWSASRY